MCKMILTGRTVVVTAGPTRERLDPVRYISNFSSGKMGYSIAKAALDMGARVILISGPVSIPVPEGAEKVDIESTLDLLDAALKFAPEADIVIQSAAPADYRPESVSPVKMKKKGGDDMVIRLVENPDVAATIGKNKRDDQVFVVFAAETNDVIDNAKGKLMKKNADMIVANDVTKPGAGFNVDTNIATIMTMEERFDYPLMSKTELAGIIVEKAFELLKGKNA